MGNLSLLKDIWLFIVRRRQWWLMPLIIVFAMLSFVLVFAQSSPLAPFIYTLF